MPLISKWFLQQVTLSKILEHWGHDGFLRHAEKTSEFYRKRRDSCIAAAEKHLKGIDMLYCICWLILENRVIIPETHATWQYSLNQNFHAAFYGSHESREDETLFKIFHSSSSYNWSAQWYLFRKGEQLVTGLEGSIWLTPR